MNLIFEFPELHGKIAAIYASEFCGVNKAISNAIEWSVFPKGDMPIPAGMPLEALVLGFCVRLDKIVGSIGKGKIPKGSSDQLGIRRAASELTKIGMRLKPMVNLGKMISHVMNLYEEQGINLLKESRELSLVFIKERLEWELKSILESEKVNAFVLQDVNWQELERARVFLSSSKESMQFLIAFYKRLSGVLESDFSKNFGNIDLNQDLSVDPRIKMQVFGQTEGEEQLGFKNASEYLDYLNILFKKTETLLNELYIKDLTLDSREKMLEFLAKVKLAADNYADFSSLRGILES
jgi:glycyl-tRNA synthetase beta subunit